MKRLPPGRSPLDRSEIEADQRRRIIAGFAAAMAEKGYATTTVEDIVRRARVSRKTFYEQFPTKQACLLSAFEQMQGLLAAGIRAMPPGRTPMLRFSEVLTGYLAAIAADPAMARLHLIEIYAAGPDAMRRRVAMQEHLVDALVENFGARSAGDRFACRSLVAVIATLVTNTLIEGGADDVLALYEPLLALAGRMLPATTGEA